MTRGWIGAAGRITATAGAGLAGDRDLGVGGELAAGEALVVDDQGGQGHGAGLAGTVAGRRDGAAAVGPAERQ